LGVSPASVAAELRAASGCTTMGLALSSWAVTTRECAGIATERPGAIGTPGATRMGTAASSFLKPSRICSTVRCV
jgi:hypothetical protein